MSMELNDDKLYYSISEVAKMFKVNSSLLRFWEKEFPFLIKPKKNKLKADKHKVVHQKEITDKLEAIKKTLQSIIDDLE